MSTCIPWHFFALCSSLHANLCSQCKGRIMKRSLSLFLALLTVTRLCTAQLKETVEQNARILKDLHGCIEGYAGAVSGETIRYPRLNQRSPEALLTRASTGTIAIEWKTQKVPRPLRTREATFVVSAGIYAQPEVGKKFQMFINDVPRFVFSTTPADSWTVKGDSGGVLVFGGVMRDQYNDAFGYLRIAVPAAWVVPGEPVRVKVVGEKAESRAWFMAFQDSAVLRFVREKAENEAYCDLLIHSRGTRNDATVTAPSTWIGRQVKCVVGGVREAVATLVQDSGLAHARFSFDASRSEPLKLLIDGALIADLGGMSRETDESRVYPKKLVSLKTRNVSTDTWKLEYQSTYVPEFGTSLIELSDASNGVGTQHFITSSHQDIAWMDTPAQCIIDRDQKVITPALAIMKESPQFCFDLEDVLELREYLERHPDRKDEIHRLLKEGRLGVGATYTMPYEDLCSGEMLVRQFYAGRKWLRSNFPGCDTKTAWNPDVPGRSMQAPQIMQKAGVKYLVISRHERGLYDWRSPDGSGILTYSPHHYALYHENTAGKRFPEAAGYLASSTGAWIGIRKGGTNIPVLEMSDMSSPANLDRFLNTWNTLKSISRTDGTAQPLFLPPLHYSTAESFFRLASAEKPDVPVVLGERPNIWLYIHGPTHHRAISAKREADILLPAAETFSTVDALLSSSFARYPRKQLTDAWEALIYPDHGWGGKNGQITDSIFLAKYEYARDAAKLVHTLATTSIAARVKADGGKGTPVVVFNSLSWKRTSPVRFTFTFVPGEIKKGLAMHDAAGMPVAVQLLSPERHGDGSLKSAEMIFVAENVPPVGYATYYLKPSQDANDVALKNAAAPDILENAFYRVALGRGGVRQVADKELGLNLLEEQKFLGGELFTMQSVGEDAGEWAEPQQPTMEGFDRLGNHRPEWRLVESGAVRQVVETRQRIEHAVAVQRVILYRALKQIDFETDLLQWDGTKYREFRLAFPVRMPKGQVAYEVPFGALEVGKDEMKGAAGERYLQEVSTVHPRSIQSWISVSDSGFGVTMSSSVAVWDYRDPTGPSGGATLLQPILLASRRSCHGEGNWYLQEGDHHYSFSLTSHRPGWRNGRQFGAGANVPITVICNPSLAPERSLPEQLSFFSTDAVNVVLSTMKKSDDDDRVVLRVWESEGKEATPALRLHWPMRSAERTNIIEEEGMPTAVGRDGVTIAVGHYSIETLRLVPGH